MDMEVSAGPFEQIVLLIVVRGGSVVRVGRTLAACGTAGSCALPNGTLGAESLFL